MHEHTIILATQNKFKTVEFQKFLTSHWPQTQHGAKNPPRLQDLADSELNVSWNEDGGSFEINAEIKARAVQSKFPNRFILSDDSGLCVPALGGLPGVESAHFAGKNSSQDSNNRKLMQQMNGIPTSQRMGYYVCVLCLLDPSGKSYFFKDICLGHIKNNIEIKSGFGFDPLFYSWEIGKTFTEASLEEKNKISHRGKAISQFINFFSASFL